MQQRLRLGCDLLSRYCNLICSPSLIYAGLYMTHSVLKVYLQGTMFVHEYSMYYLTSTGMAQFKTLHAPCMNHARKY